MRSPDPRMVGGASTAPLVVLAAVVALVGALVATPAPAAAETCDGVWVVVDAREVGGGTNTRCAPGNPSSGLDALSKAGFSYAFVPRQPGMVCTIDSRPDPCNGAPTDAYWSYWHAPAGGSWTYASSGAGQRDPAPGTVEGWAFGAGSPPGQHPPANATSSDTSGDEEPAPSGGGGGGSTTDSDGGSGGSGGRSAAGSGDGGASSGGSSEASSTGGSGEGDGSSSQSSTGNTSSGAGDSGPADTDAADTDPNGDGEGEAGDADDGEDDAREDDGEPATDDEPDADGNDDDADDDADAGDQTVTELDDVVAIDGADRGGGRSAAGLVAGGTLIAAIAGAAALRARRRVGIDG